MILRTFVKAHPVAMYFALTFAISWGGILILGAPYGMPTARGQFEEHWFIVFLPYFAGPITAGLLLTGLVHGRAGFRELRSRLFRWRVRASWYAVGLLTAPSLVLITLLALSQTSSEFLPGILTTADRIGLVASGIMIAFVFGGLIEEMGWTGFAVPGLSRRYGVLAAGLIVGLLWGLWHFLPTYWGSGDASGAVSLDLLVPPCLFYAGVLPAYRVLMVWVHEHTGSLFVAILMHGSLTASTIFILAPSATGTLLSVYYIILAVVLWVVVAMVATRDGGQLSQRQLCGQQESRAVQLVE